MNDIDIISKLTDEGKKTYRRLLDLEDGTGSQTTVIQVMIDTAGGSVVADITNLDVVKDKIGKLVEYPQIVIVSHSDTENKEIYYPVSYSTQTVQDVTSTTVSYGSLNPSVYQIGGINLVHIDGTVEWGVIVNNFA